MTLLNEVVVLGLSSFFGVSKVSSGFPQWSVFCVNVVHPNFFLERTVFFWKRQKVYLCDATNEVFSPSLERRDIADLYSVELLEGKRSSLSFVRILLRRW